MGGQTAVNTKLTLIGLNSKLLYLGHAATESVDAVCV